MLSTSVQAKLGTHVILREVNRDGFGILYLAQCEREGELLLVRALAADIVNGENFLVRFDLLKLILPNIRHPHLTAVRELGRDGDVFFLVYALPLGEVDDVRTLSSFDTSEVPCRSQALVTIFEGIAEGLVGLESVRDHYFTDGLIHDALHPDNIIISFEPALIGSAVQPIARLTGYAESFLCYGDSASSLLAYRITPSLYHWRAGTPDAERPDLYTEEMFYPPQLRQGEATPKWLHLYSFGVLVYWYISRRIPRGIFPLSAA